MFSTSLINVGVFLSNMVQKEPGAIVGPITRVFGVILNFIFDFVNGISPTEANILGISIILMTIVARLIMLPLAIKSHKSMVGMQKVQPEMEKIKAKYGNSKDPEAQKKMSMEINELYRKNNVSMFGGCLPLFIQFPLFMALYYLMNQSYIFITRLGSLYHDLATRIMEIPGYFTPIYNLGFSKIPRNMEIDTRNVDDLMKLINKFKIEDWDIFLNEIPQEYVAGITEILDKKQDIEQFLTISLTENTGLYWPAIIIPIVAVLATFLSSYLSTKQSRSSDPNMMAQQKIMMFGMPIMMGFITLGMPGGVGLYWITSNIFQVVQQIVLNKFMFKDDLSGTEVIEATGKEVKKKTKLGKK